METGSRLYQRLVRIVKDREMPADEKAEGIDAIVNEAFCVREEKQIESRQGEIFTGVLVFIHNALKKRRDETGEHSPIFFAKVTSCLAKIFTVVKEVSPAERKKWFSIYEEVLGEMERKDEAEIAAELCTRHIQNCLLLDINASFVAGEYKRLSVLLRKTPGRRINSTVCGGLFLVLAKIAQTETATKEIKTRVEKLTEELSSCIEDLSPHSIAPMELLHGVSLLSREAKALGGKTLERLSSLLVGAFPRLEEPEKTAAGLFLSGEIGANIVLDSLDRIPAQSKKEILGTLSTKTLSFSALKRLSKHICPFSRLLEKSETQCHIAVSQKRFDLLFGLQPQYTREHTVTVANKTALLQRQDIPFVFFLFGVNTGLKIIFTRILSKLSQLSALIRQRQPTEDMVYLLCVFVDVLFKECPSKYTAGLNTLIGSLPKTIEKILGSQVSVFLKREAAKRTAALLTAFANDIPQPETESILQALASNREVAVCLGYPLLKLERTLSLEKKSGGIEKILAENRREINTLQHRLSDAFFNKAPGRSKTPSAKKEWDRAALVQLLQEEFSPEKRYTHSYREASRPPPQTHQPSKPPADHCAKRAQGAIRLLRDYAGSLAPDDDHSWLCSELKDILKTL
ncbi:MAG: uncharacterized protein A8A55_0698 [Amphiamblys sp. WSBS2006]|nr:MAG: uncharacterized protein A8A55_0698 [Amphiamblys sp. WSBS2006]